MPQRITPSRVVTTSKDGEVHVTITLELNINLNSTGVAMASIPPPESKQVDEIDSQEDLLKWHVPDFDSLSDFTFGKDVN